jgi:hypothetical protein
MVGDFPKHSLVVALVTALSSFVVTVACNSFLYRWLTTEPEPDVIVIDLTETWSVGPLIGVLDRVARMVVPLWHSSWFKREAEKSVSAWETLVNGSVVLRSLVRLLAPPADTGSREGKD